MKLQFKILIIVIPFVLLSLLSLGLWSFTEAEKAVYLSKYRYLRIVLESYMAESLHPNYQLLKEAKMEKVASYVKDYKQDAIKKAEKIAKVRGGHILILNYSGELVFCSQGFNSANLELSWNEISKKIVGEDSTEILEGYIDKKPYDDVYVAQYFKPWGWVVFYSIPNEDISVLVNKIRLITLGITFVCALVSSLLIFLFSKKYLLQPIAKLKDAAHSIATHKNIGTISINSKDELGLLARSMETMSKSIALYKTERKHAEKELLQKHEELQKSQVALKRHQDSLEQLVDERTFMLMEREEQYRAVAENIGDHIMRYDRDFKHIYANKPAIEATGLSIDQYIGKTHREMGFPDHLCKLWEKNIKLVFETGKQQNVDFDVELAESKMSSELQLNPEFAADGGVKTVIGISRDITSRRKAEIEKRKLESQLHQAQKMESLGQLAGGVAHEINNPINGIMNYAQLIQDKIGEENPLSEYTSEIIHETERVSKIVKNLLVFARQEKESHSQARIIDIVDDTMSLIQTVLKRDQITLIADISEDLPKIKCRSQQIQQVVMNLITNARDSLNEKYPGFDDNKKIEIISVLIEKDGKRWIRTTVEDRGLGITSDNMERMFDPFFTTKERSKGTGLGLSISYGIVKDHHGELSVESEPGHYTRFHMDLPVDNGGE